MDPNATLAEIRDAIAAYGRGELDDQEYAEAITERLVALDDWISAGGFLPTAWQRSA
jgi:hypothetical protein